MVVSALLNVVSGALVAYTDCRAYTFCMPDENAVIPPFLHALDSSDFNKRLVRKPPKS